MQYATLCFLDKNNKEIIGGTSQRQKEGTHINLVGANDWAGRGSEDQSYLLAPFDCVVKAIGKSDNTVFFESCDQVFTPKGIKNVWFMCTHMFDADLTALGVAVGRIFRQGQKCYREGAKGIGGGNHMHIEQGFGKFNGSSSPYYKSSDYYIYNGKKYAQYYPCTDGSENPVADVFYLKRVELVKASTGKTMLDHYPAFKFVPEEPIDDTHLFKVVKDPNYEYRWSVDGNKYNTKYDVTTMTGFADLDLVGKGFEEVIAVNGSLFFKTNEGGYMAEGLEKSRGINNQELEMTAVTDYNNCMAVAAVDEDLWFGRQSWIIANRLDEAYGAITGMGLVIGGKACDGSYHNAYSEWNGISGRTIIGEDQDGNFMSYSIAGVTGQSGITGQEAQNLAIRLGFYNAVMFDGGGSVWRRLNGKVDISTTRAVKNALILYRRKRQDSNVETPPENDIPVDQPVEQPSEDFEYKYKELLKELDEALAENDILNDKNEKLVKLLEESNEGIVEAKELLTQALDKLK